MNILLLSTVCRKDKNKEKEAGIGPLFKRACGLIRGEAIYLFVNSLQIGAATFDPEPVLQQPKLVLEQVLSKCVKVRTGNAGWIRSWTSLWRFEQATQVGAVLEQVCDGLNRQHRLEQFLNKCVKLRTGLKGKKQFFGQAWKGIDRLWNMPHVRH